MTIKIGRFVESTDNHLGAGKLVDVEDDIAVIQYFDSPVNFQDLNFRVPFKSIVPKPVYAQTRAFYYNTTLGAWQVGRVVIENEDSYIIQFPNKRILSVPAPEMYVRWNNPISNPSELLALRINETPFFHNGRYPFMNSLIKQRGGCMGMSGLYSSIIDLEMHQIEVVRRVLHDPIQRYLLADEVGLGKTIEAGIIIRQYVLEYPTNHKILIIIPEHLKAQWHTELCNKFLLSPFIGKTIHLIANTDIVKIKSLGTKVGMVVIDEAHQVAVQESLADLVENEIFNTIKMVAHNAERLLLLSATPVLHNEQSYLAMLHILDPTIYSLDDYNQFKLRIEKRQEVAESFHALQEDSPNFFIEGVIEDISIVFPEDNRLQSLIEELRPRISFDAPEDDADRAMCIQAIRVHLSEVYRLHRRLLRNRRTGDLEDLVPGRAGLKSINYEDSFFCWIEEILDEWRIAASSSIYRREDSEEATKYTEIAWTLYEIAICDPFLLPLALTARTNTDIDLNLPFSKAIIDILRSVPMYDGEQKILNKILQTSFEIKDARLDALEAFFIDNADKEDRYVVFATYRESADRIYKHLKTVLGSSHVVRHRIGSEMENDIKKKIFICDRTAEEGLNLQGGNAAMVHFDLPFSPNRIEQRIGRLDRFGVADPVRSIALIADDAPVMSAWASCLDGAYGAFSRSIASLQYVIDSWMDKTLKEFLANGEDSIHNMASFLGGEEGLLNIELDNIKKQDELDSLETIQENDMQIYDHLWEVDMAWNQFAQATDAWLKDRLHFGKRGETSPEDTVIRYQYYPPDERGPSTLIPLDELIDRFENIIDIGYSRKRHINPISFPMTFKRQTARSRNVRLARIGEPFINSLMQYIRKDDRGVSFAMWRYRPKLNIEGNYMLAFRFDFIVEVDIDLPGSHSVALANTTPEALKLRSDTLLPPIMQTVWLDEDLQPVADSSLMEIITEPYHTKPWNKDGMDTKQWNKDGMDYNLNPLRWQQIDSILDPSSWYSLCQAAHLKAVDTLNNDSNLQQYLQNGVARTKRISAIHMEQLRSRLELLDGQAIVIEQSQIDLEKAVSDTIIQGIHNPSMILDAAGAVFISPENPFGDVGY